MAQFGLDENGDITYIEPPKEEAPLDVENSDSGTTESTHTEENSGSLFEPTEENLQDGSEVDGNLSDEILNQGNFATDSLQDSQAVSQAQETTVINTADSPVPVALEEPVSTALVQSITPHSGALSSSTLNYFDRIVSGLPDDYIYIAYRTNSNSSSDGVLYYGDDYEVDGSTVTFRSGAVETRVYRVNSGYDNETEYLRREIGNTDVNLSHNSTLVFYSNAETGFPILGGYEKPFSISPFLVVGLVTALAVVVLQKLLCRK